MRGLMQDVPLTLTMLVERAERLFPEKAVVSVTHQGKDRSTLGSVCERARRLGRALDDLGVSDAGRVATFAWNHARHLEAYFAAPCTGRVLHTLNIRLFPEQLVYIANHAEDEVVLVDRSLLGLFWPLVERMPTVRHVLVMDDGAGEVPDDPRVLDYEDVVAASRPGDFTVDDEWRAASMCYTSGTTGNPKGVVYSHRSTVLHTMATLMADALALSERDVLLPVVPMFHANAWGLAHGGVFAGSSLVMPGPDLSPRAIADLIVDEGVTVAAGVPTVWMGVLDHLKGREGIRLREIGCGGSAVPKALSEAYREAIGIPILQAWGMTETHPLASIARVRSSLQHEPEDVQADVRASQGLMLPGVQVRIVEPGGDKELPWDGSAFGELQAKGPWVASGYYDDPRSAESFTADGWLRTGDVATIDPDGYIRLVDRTKDLIKSGGEWISTIELENELMAHPKVAEAAVVAVPHPRWMERPLACVVVKPGEELTKDEVLEFLRPRVAKWWLPDDVVFIDEVPKTSTGKFSKKDLRDRFADWKPPSET